MSDERLRAAERAFEESGSAVDEARLLEERLRAGTLDPSRLALAAHCGHPAARLALGRHAPPDEPDLRKWCAALERFGIEASVRAAHAAAASVVHFWNERPDPSVAYLGEAPPGEQLAAVQEWIDCPCEYHVKEALDTLPVGATGIISVHGEHAWTLAHDAAIDAVLTVRRPSFTWGTFINAALAHARDVPDPKAADAAHQAIRDLACAALIRWALA